MADDSPTEHIYIGSDNLNPDPALASRTVEETIVLTNPVRGTRLEFTIYAEGFLKIDQYRHNRSKGSFRLDLHYLDPVPRLRREIAWRPLYATGGFAALAALTGILLAFGVWPAVTLVLASAAAGATLVALFVSAYRSYEHTEFVTRNGQTPVLQLLANLGCMQRFRAFTLTLRHAIEKASKELNEEGSALLRGEMREHYRLRDDGVMSHSACSDSTARILAQFDAIL